MADISTPSALLSLKNCLSVVNESLAGINLIINPLPEELGHDIDHNGSSVCFENHSDRGDFSIIHPGKLTTLFLPLPSFLLIWMAKVRTINESTNKVLMEDQILREGWSDESRAFVGVLELIDFHFSSIALVSLVTDSFLYLISISGSFRTAICNWWPLQNQGRFLCDSQNMTAFSTRAKSPFLWSPGICDGLEVLSRFVRETCCGE